MNTSPPLSKTTNPPLSTINGLHPQKPPDLDIEALDPSWKMALMSAILSCIEKKAGTSFHCVPDPVTAPDKTSSTSGDNVSAGTFTKISTIKRALTEIFAMICARNKNANHIPAVGIFDSLGVPAKVLVAINRSTPGHNQEALQELVTTLKEIIDALKEAQLGTKKSRAARNDIVKIIVASCRQKILWHFGIDDCIPQARPDKPATGNASPRKGPRHKTKTHLPTDLKNIALEFSSNDFDDGAHGALTKLAGDLTSLFSTSEGEDNENLAKAVFEVYRFCKNHRCWYDHTSTDPEFRKNLKQIDMPHLLRRISSISWYIWAANFCVNIVSGTPPGKEDDIFSGTAREQPSASCAGLPESHWIHSIEVIPVSPPPGALGSLVSDLFQGEFLISRHHYDSCIARLRAQFQFLKTKASDTGVDPHSQFPFMPSFEDVIIELNNAMAHTDCTTENVSPPSTRGTSDPDNTKNHAGSDDIVLEMVAGMEDAYDSDNMSEASQEMEQLVNKTSHTHDENMKQYLETKTSPARQPRPAKANASAGPSKEGLQKHQVSARNTTSASMTASSSSNGDNNGIKNRNNRKNERGKTRGSYRGRSRGKGRSSGSGSGRKQIGGS
ncbi:hypothetical protein F503_04770 [Ophiostoma piceae UAMH 11346]|uniref:Uncharacterized protein n=1 Tax=Ophiostoma piceae (strain UAMH 11346) TaxID=1262450 RepID=S3CU92_OPHP1|nr:hypothetical protein F503_04770 [Ophiostoma piceae UAMH 11346]